MSSVARWDMSLPLSAACTLMDAEQYEMFLAELCADHEFLPSGEQVVLIVGGHYASHDQLSAFLAGVGPQDLPSSLLRQVTEKLDSAFSEFVFSSKDIESLLCLLEKEDACKAFGPTLRILLDLYIFLEQIYLSCAVAMTNVSASRRPHWWISRPHIVQEIEKWRARLRFEISQGRPLEDFLNKLNDIHSIVRVLERREAGSIKEVLVAASAICFVCAEILHARRSSSASLMLSNRATEYVLSAIAVEAGLALETVHGIKFSDGESAGVSRLLDILVASGKLGARFGNGHIFGNVNTARNQLSFTHGLSAVREEEVGLALEELRQEIRRLDPTLGWWSKVTSARPMLKASLKALGSALEFYRWVDRKAPAQVENDIRNRAN